MNLSLPSKRLMRMALLIYRRETSKRRSRRSQISKTTTLKRLSLPKAMPAKMWAVLERLHATLDVNDMAIVWRWRRLSSMIHASSSLMTRCAGSPLPSQGQPQRHAP